MDQEPAEAVQGTRRRAISLSEAHRFEHYQLWERRNHSRRDNRSRRRVLEFRAFCQLPLEKTHCVSSGPAPLSLLSLTRVSVSVSMRGNNGGGSAYENDFLLHSSPFSSSSNSAMGAPPPIGSGPPPKGDSSQQQQQAATATALALFNRYTGGGMKGFADFHPSHYQTALGHHNSTTPLGFNETEFPSLSAQPSMMNRASAGFGGMPPGPIGSAFGGSRGSAGAGGNRSAYGKWLGCYSFLSYPTPILLFSEPYEANSRSATGISNTQRGFSSVTRFARYGE